MENITEQFNAVALEYDWVTTLLEELIQTLSLYFCLHIFNM